MCVEASRQMLGVVSGLAVAYFPIFIEERMLGCAVRRNQCRLNERWISRVCPALPTNYIYQVNFLGDKCLNTKDPTIETTTNHENRGPKSVPCCEWGCSVHTLHCS